MRASGGKEGETGGREGRGGYLRFIASKTVLSGFVQGRESLEGLGWSLGALRTK